jgi:ABC-2 type transport system ATP-binding protein
VRLDGVGRRYGRRGPWVLRDVDLTLHPGSLVRIEGVNGGGKSTLLRLLAGADAPSAGRLTGRPRATAYVPERFPGALPLTALGYLVHLGRVHGLSGKRAARAAGEWLERLDAAEFADSPLRELSKGSCQKVAVAQALLAEPELLILDEAWTGLDAHGRGILDRAVAMGVPPDGVWGRVRAGATAVYVDHDPRRLADAAPTVHRVAHGRLTTAAAPRPPEPTAHIEAEGPPGSPPPDGLPGGPCWQRLPDGGIRLTVPAAHSDALLHALLAAHPPWHIRAVTSRP